MTMPFGKHEGVRIAALPDGYLDWLHDQDWLHGRLREAVEEEWRRRWDPPHQQRQTPPPPFEMPTLDAQDRALLAELIRVGYRQMALKYHPDTGGATETMQRLNKLMTVLRKKIVV